MTDFDLLSGSGDQTVIIHDSDSSHNTSDPQASHHAHPVAELAQGMRDTVGVGNQVCTSDSRLHTASHGSTGTTGSGYLTSDACLNERVLAQQSNQLSSSSAGASGGFDRSQDVLCSYQLPSYRLAPDYDTVMQLRALARCQQQLRSVASNHQDMLFSYSQPDIYQAMPPQNLYHYNPAVFHTESGSAGMQYVGRPVDRSSSLVVRPLTSGPHTVMRHSSAVTAATHQVGGPPYVYYRSPPPYPRQSNSTPELASPPMLSGTTLNVGGDAGGPRRPAPAAVLSTRSAFDQSIENLALDVSQLHIRHGPMIDALLASNFHPSTVGYGQFGSRPDVNGNNGYQSEVNPANLDSGEMPLGLNQDVLQAQYGRDFAVTDVANRYSPHSFHRFAVLFSVFDYLIPELV
jgi:hypothetical protein